MSENVHKGHRERMRQRFLVEGTKGFADHELLELLLYYAVPRGDVNPLAHRMLAEFGTLSMLLSADPADISRRCGVKESTAVLLVLQSALAHRLQQEKWRDKPVLDSVSKAGAFAVDLLSHYHYERFYVLCLDNRKQLIHSCMISEGTVDESVVYPRLVVEAALRYQASSVILMHNHPGGTLMPSFSDVELTARMARILHEIGIEVADHIIVAENQYFSFLEHDYLKEKQIGGFYMKKLYRSKTDVKISGVCGGLAEYFNIDATLVRLIWVLVSLLTSGIIGLIVYVVCVFVIPVDDGYVDAEFNEKK